MPEGVLDGARKGRDATRLDAKHAQIARRAASGRCRYALIFLLLWSVFRSTEHNKKT